MKTRLSRLLINRGLRKRAIQMMRIDYLRKIGVKVILSLLGASLFYFSWLAIFLLTRDLESRALEIAFWLLTPVITATGFAVGVTIYERLTRTNRIGFLRTFVWPLVGCSVGAGVVYWFGPMLIVFGMFGAGTISVVLREIVQFSED